MAIETIAGSPASGASPVGLQDFLRILLTQLNYQDPLKPMDNQAFMAQMAQFTALEQTQRLNDKVEQLVANQAALQSVGLIGRQVEVQAGSGPIFGTVTALSWRGDSPVLSVTTASSAVLADISLGQVLSVR